MTTSIRYKWPYIYRIEQFLIKKFLSGYIDNAEPIEFLLVCSTAKINCQFVVKKFLFLIGSKSLEIERSPVFILNVEAMSKKLTDREGALLSINHFVIAVAILTPIHYIERKTF